MNDEVKKKCSLLEYYEKRKEILRKLKLKEKNLIIPSCENMINEILCKKAEKITKYLIKRDERKTMKKCFDCGKSLEDDDDFFMTENNEIICQDCYHKDYYTCSDCERIIHYSNTAETKDGDIICENCFDNNYFRCNDCNDVYHVDNGTKIGRNSYICERCLENYNQCEDCGEWVHCDDSYYCEDCSVSLCGECYNQNHDHCKYDDGTIKNYNFKPDATFFKSKKDRKKEKLFIGIELEVENKKNNFSNEEYVKNYLENHIELYCKYDGSIEDGFEIVSHPMTLNCHHEFKWKEILENLTNNGFLSHNTSTCGLHLHISKNVLTESEKIKFGLFVNLQILKMEVIGRRSNNSYAQFKEIHKGDLKNANRNYNERYEAINWYNDDTIELRFPKGTLKYETFISTVELAHSITLFVKTISISMIMDIDKSWSLYCDFIKGKKDYKNLVTYLKEKNLFPEIKGEIKGEIIIP